MKRITSIVSLIAVLVFSVFIANAALITDSTITIEADNNNKDRGYVEFEFTTFRDGRYLIEAVVEGTDGPYRDRKIIMTTQSTGDPWTLFDIVTEDDAVEIWWGYVDESTVVVKVEDEPFLEFEIDSNGDTEVTYMNDELELGFAAMHLFIGMFDTNLGPQIAARSTVPVMRPFAPGPGVVMAPPPCWGPCNVGPCCTGPGAACNNCCNCCNSGCPGADVEVCQFPCQVKHTIPPTPGPNGTPPSWCMCG